MSTRKSATVTETPEQVVEHLRSLIAEAEKTLGAEVSEGTQDKLSALRERLSDMKVKLEDGMVVAREKIVAGAKQADTAIRSHPYESLAIALGIGVLLGAALRRNN